MCRSRGWWGQGPRVRPLVRRRLFAEHGNHPRTRCSQQLLDAASLRHARRGVTRHCTVISFSNAWHPLLLKSLWKR